LVIRRRVATIALPPLLIPTIVTAITLPSIAGRPTLVLPTIPIFLTLVHGLLLCLQVPWS
jgi:hypothetical protein